MTLVPGTAALGPLSSQGLGLGSTVPPGGGWRWEGTDSELTQNEGRCSLPLSSPRWASGSRVSKPTSPPTASEMATGPGRAPSAQAALTTVVAAARLSSWADAGCRGTHLAWGWCLVGTLQACTAPGYVGGRRPRAGARWGRSSPAFLLANGSAARSELDRNGRSGAGW